MFISSLLIVLIFIVVDFIVFRGLFTKMVVWSTLITGTMVGVLIVLEYLAS